MSFDPNQKRGGAANAGNWTKYENSDPEAGLEPPVKSYENSTPIECDMELAELWGKRETIVGFLRGDKDRINAHEKEMAFREKYPGKTRSRWSVMGAGELERAQNRVVEYEAERDAFSVLMKPIEDKHAKDQWSRFFLVRNSGGHIHSSMRCSTCRWSTQFVWLPERSGADEAETVALAGDGACSVCYPSAPVADRNNPRPNQLETPEVIAGRIERAEAKAAKAAKALATGIWGADGGELREAARPGSRYLGQVIKSERTAELMAVDAIVSEARAKAYQERNHPGEPAHEPNEWDLERSETYNLIIPALASKRGQSIEVVDAFIRDKATKKYAKENK